MKYAQSLVGFFSVLTLASAFATQASAGEDRPVRRFGLFGGAHFGYSSLSTDDISNASGTQLDLLAIGSFYREHWVFDLGMGFGRNSMDGTYKKTAPYNLVTKTAVLELSPRYLLGSRWQLGPVLDLGYGATDFSPVTPADKQGLQARVGAKIAYEMPVSWIDLRLTSKAELDPQLGQRHLYVFSGGIEIGLYRVAMSSSPDTVPAKPMAAIDSGPVVKLDLPMNLVEFEFGSDRIDESSKAFLAKLAAVIKGQGDNWSVADVVGHTDRRGDEAFNQDLSERRAKAVVAALAEAGVDHAKLRPSGKGESQPLDPAHSEKAYARNRRVQLIFKEVSDTQRLSDALKKIAKE